MIQAILSLVVAVTNAVVVNKKEIAPGGYSIKWPMCRLLVMQEHGGIRPETTPNGIEDHYHIPMVDQVLPTGRVALDTLHMLLTIVAVEM